MAKCRSTGLTAEQMYNQAVMGNRFAPKGLLVAAVGAATLVGLLELPRVSAQSVMTDWEKAAGGNMSFDVASVKQNAADPSPTTVQSNIPLGPQNAFAPTGGLFSATNFPLIQYLIFAYKLSANEVDAVQSQLPKWANADRYDVQAHAAGNPTKDQYRLMMQALLADRFKLVIHFETKEVPVLALLLDKPGKLGPHFKLHPADSPCPTAPVADAPATNTMPTVEGGFPAICAGIQVWPSPTPGRVLAGARGMTMERIVNSIGLARLLGADRPILDKTGLAGMYDFVAEFSPDPQQFGGDFQADPNGPTFLEALKEQLGLKLESQKGPATVIVIDHIEEPLPN